MRPSSKPANPESPRLRSRPAVNRNGGRLACADGGRKHRLPHKRGFSEPEGCVRCSPAATRRHAVKARLAVVPAPGSWPLENGASPPWRCAVRETWRTNLSGIDREGPGSRVETPWHRQAFVPLGTEIPYSTRSGRGGTQVG